MRKCRKCEQDLQNDWKFCPMCGASNKMRLPSNQIAMRLDQPLGPEDWKIILGLPWDKWNKKFIQDLAETLNEPSNHIGSQSVNGLFIKYGHCYRLIAVHYATTAKNQTLYKIFKTAPK